MKISFSTTMTCPRSKKATESEAKMQEALNGLSSGLYKTPYKAHKALGISKSTLLRRINGGKSRAEARQAQQLLSKAQEKALAEWISQLTATGHPARHEFIREMAEEIRKQRDDSIDARTTNLPISREWVPQFLNRHPHLKTRLIRSIEAARIKDVTKDAVIGWFAQLQETIEKHQITLENIYNMDETGLLYANCINSRFFCWD